MGPDGSRGTVIIHCVNILHAKQDPQKISELVLCAWGLHLFCQWYSSIKAICLNLYNYSYTIFITNFLSKLPEDNIFQIYFKLFHLNFLFLNAMLNVSN